MTKKVFIHLQNGILASKFGKDWQVARKAPTPYPARSHGNESESAKRKIWGLAGFCLILLKQRKAPGRRREKPFIS